MRHFLRKVIFFIPISTMQRTIFHQSYFFGVTVSFHDNILKNEHKLCKIYPVFVSDALETLKHQNLFSLIIFLCVRCNFSQTLLSVH